MAPGLFVNNQRMRVFSTLDSIYCFIGVSMSDNPVVLMLAIHEANVGGYRGHRDK